jgi:hypothetical protein
MARLTWSFPPLAVLGGSEATERRVRTVSRLHARGTSRVQRLWIPVLSAISLAVRLCPASRYNFNDTEH